MLATWDLFVNGHDYTVAVERLPNGRDAIRINGRIAAKPLDPGDAECCVSVGGVPYTISRRGKDDFAIEEDPLAQAQTRTETTAKAVLAHSADSPLPFLKSSLLRGPVIAWTLVVIAAGLLLFWAKGPGYEKLAAERVDKILHDMKSGRDVEMQFSVTLWAKNRRVLDQTEMNIATNHFDRWRQAKDIYNKPFSSYKIVKSELVKEEKNPTALVTFTIEDKEYKVRVPKDDEISWAD
ncbi:MAG TPA: hypothetical protein VGJ82_17010 [Thermoanaerobaculia bacterium]